MKTYRIATIPGDGIGNEVVPEGIRVLEAAGRKFGIGFTWDEKPWSCAYYAKHGRMMPEDGLEQIRNHDAIYLGAVGFPGVPDHVSLWGLLIPIRREFQQYVNLRPVRLMPGVHEPARRPQARRHRLLGRAREQRGRVLLDRRAHVRRHRAGVRAPSSRCSRRRAATGSCATPSSSRRRARRKHVTSATKSNGISITMPYWDERFKAISAEYPEVQTSQFHIDILTAHFVQHPDWFDVVVGSNLFGDILSDLGPGLHRHHRHRARRQHQPRARVPVHVRAGARQRPGHRGQGHRQPHRPDLVGRDDAGAPGAPRTRRRDREGDRAGARRTARARATWAAPPARRRWARRSPTRSRRAVMAKGARKRGIHSAPRARREAPIQPEETHSEET